MIPNSLQKNIQVIDDWGFFVKIDDDPIILTKMISKNKPRLIFISEEEETEFYSKIRKYTPTRSIIVMRNISSSHKNSESITYFQKNEKENENENENENEDEKEKEKEKEIIQTNYPLKLKITYYIFLTTVLSSGFLLFFIFTHKNQNPINNYYHL